MFSLARDYWCNGKAMDQDSVAAIEKLLERIQSGDEGAKRELFELVDERLRRLTRSMLGGFAVVRRWEETDDVWQNASLRVWQSLEKVEFESARHFLNTSALQIRRELLSMAERYRRPGGPAARHHTPVAHESRDPNADFVHPTDDVHVLDSWTAIHQKVDQLDEEHREVFDLHWYQGLTIDAISKLLDVSSRTVKRRWQTARLALHEAMDFER